MFIKAPPQSPNISFEQGQFNQDVYNSCRAPLVHAVHQGSQTVDRLVWTRVNFNQIHIDTHSCFNGHTFWPKIPGYYWVGWAITLKFPMNFAPYFTTWYIDMIQNGASISRDEWKLKLDSTDIPDTFSMQGHRLVFFDGNDDQLAVYLYHTHATGTDIIRSEGSNWDGPEFHAWKTQH